jgi:hypothetical protein
MRWVTRWDEWQVKEISQDAKWRVKEISQDWQRSRNGLKTECPWLAVNTRDDTEKQASVGPCLIRSLVRCLIRSLVRTSLSDSISGSNVLVWFDRPCDSTVLVIRPSLWFDRPCDLDPKLKRPCDLENSNVLVKRSWRTSLWSLNVLHD